MSNRAQCARSRHRPHAKKGIELLQTAVDEWEGVRDERPKPTHNRSTGT